jgi:putative AdoMet-dependent methyltransferase
MRSRFADSFNHDADAPDYDRDVAVETHPIRAGYAALLEWVARTAQVAARHEVLELGAGTGNLTTLLRAARHIVAVDVSREMLALAERKVGGAVTWVHDDLLGFFDTSTARFDRVVSTYAIHHLVADEKRTLFQRIRDCLAPRGRAVFGDLMFESDSAMQAALRRYRDTGSIDVADAIRDEFFWLLDDCVPALTVLGFAVTTERFSDLSWGVCASLP